MMLVDTSVWVDHLVKGNPSLAALLEAGEVETHTFVVGELALGRLCRRKETLGYLAALPGVPEAEHWEVLGLVEEHDLAGSGLGWVDAHLLASALVGGIRLWTSDRTLAAAAARLGVGRD
ncbi:MAG: type II toxin-antitoxin system VapC family toxin [Actinomycetota bacterium]